MPDLGTPTEDFGHSMDMSVDTPPDLPTDMKSESLDSIEEFIEAEHEELCNKILACTDQPDLVREFMTFFGVVSVADCKIILAGLRGSPAQHAAAFDAGHLEYRTQEADACLRTVMPSLVCGDIARLLQPGIERYRPYKGCHDVLVGSLEEDVQCTFDAECGDDLGCSRGYSNNPAEPLPCHGTCRRERTQLSGTCDPTFCAAGQYCGDLMNGVCFPRDQDGQPCSRGDQCQATSSCDLETGLCVANASNLELGQGCDYATRLCKPGTFCDNTNNDGVCLQAAEIGEPCFITGCVAGAVCNPAGQCDALLASGSACVVDAQCESLRCANGTCTDGDALCN